MEKVDLWIRNTKVYNSYLKEFRDADVAVKEGKFYYIDIRRETGFDAQQEIDAKGLYMLPGLVDIHMHIESSMVTPGAMAEYLAKNGVTTVVSEPHEIANVKGLWGIEEMIRAGEGLPVDIYYGIPSSVPSSKPDLETTGASVDAQAMKALYEKKEVVCVGEIMNWKQLIEGKEPEIAGFLRFLKERDSKFPVEGHCPGAVDLELARILFRGIDADHTEHTLEEIRQRVENGMFVEIQQKMLKEDILSYLCEKQLFEYCCFVTDDTMADTLWREGQLNRVVENAMKLGFPMEQAVYCATYTPARRMQLLDRGVIAPGKLADFQLMEWPESMRPVQVFKQGKEIYKLGNKRLPEAEYTFPPEFYRSVQLPEITAESFRIAADITEGTVTVRAIEVQSGQTQTRVKLVRMPVRGGFIQWEDSGCLLAAVLERHGKNTGMGLGFITGNCHKEGTVATTYLHDHHNLLVAGDDIQDMILAVRRIQKLQGGILTVQKGCVLEELPLPVCGIMSGLSVEQAGKKLAAVRGSMEQLGYVHENPIMSFACLSLPVSPAVKLTNFGLIDVKQEKQIECIYDEGGNL